MSNQEGSNKVKIAPSLLAADWSALAREIEAVEGAGADVLHLDVMDGVFVPPISYGQDFVRSVRKLTTLPLDVHLMVSSPEKHIESFVQAGADIITFHVEATMHAHRLLQTIKGYGVKAGIALNPGTSPSLLEPCLSECDLVLAMTVNPGWGGQSFISDVLDKIKFIAEHPKRPHGMFLEVDGGINAETAARCVEHGANLLVAGTSIFGKENYTDAIKALRTKS